MSDMPLYVELSFGDETIRLNGRGGPSSDGLVIDHSGIDGWYSSPETKVSLTERQTGDGAHGVEDEMVLYAARTVFIPFHAIGTSRDETVGILRSINEACHRNVTLRVVDASHDTFAKGYVRTIVEPRWDRGLASGEIEVVCADPRRCSTDAATCILLPSRATGRGGLFFGEGGAGLSFDIDFGDEATDFRNVGVLSNKGSAPSWPVVTLTGPLGTGSAVSISAGGTASEVSYAPAVPAGQTVVIDFLTRTASSNGGDASRGIASRGFAAIPPGGEMSFSLLATGTGSATVTARDTYI